MCESKFIDCGIAGREASVCAASGHGGIDVPLKEDETNPSRERLLEAFGPAFAENYERIISNLPPGWSPSDAFEEAFALTHPDEMHVDPKALGSAKCHSR